LTGQALLDSAFGASSSLRFTGQKILWVAGAGSSFLLTGQKPPGAAAVVSSFLFTGQKLLGAVSTFLSSVLWLTGHVAGGGAGGCIGATTGSIGFDGFDPISDDSDFRGLGNCNGIEWRGNMYVLGTSMQHLRYR
jgi:hypothetical protein